MVILPSADRGGSSQLKEKPKPHFPVIKRPGENGKFAKGRRSRRSTLSLRGRLYLRIGWLSRDGRPISYQPFSRQLVALRLAVASI